MHHQHKQLVCNSLDKHLPSSKFKPSETSQCTSPIHVGSSNRPVFQPKTLRSKYRQCNGQSCKHQSVDGGVVYNGPARRASNDAPFQIWTGAAWPALGSTMFSVRLRTNLPAGENDALNTLLTSTFRVFCFAFGYVFGRSCTTGRPFFRPAVYMSNTGVFICCR